MAKPTDARKETSRVGIHPNFDDSGWSIVTTRPDGTEALVWQRNETDPGQTGEIKPIAVHANIAGTYILRTRGRNHSGWTPPPALKGPGWETVVTIRHGEALNPERNPCICPTFRNCLANRSVHPARSGE